jgi:hypothetical protein
LSLSLRVEIEGERQADNEPERLGFATGELDLKS